MVEGAHAIAPKWAIQINVTNCMDKNLFQPLITDKNYETPKYTKNTRNKVMNHLASKEKIPD